MRQFKYKARDGQGSLYESVISAENEDAARNQITEKGLWIVEISIIQEQSKNILDFELDGLFGGNIGLKDMVVFCRQFSTLVNSGVAVVRSFNILSTQCENRAFGKILTDIKSHIEQGLSLADAFGKYPKIFDNLFVSMIKAGETGGVLDIVMNRLAKFMEDRARLNNKIRSAMAYPTVVSLVAVVIFFVMLTVILPKFGLIFKRLGADLPAYTQFLMNISDVLITLSRFPWCIVVVAFIVCTIWGYKVLYSIESGKYYFDSLFLKLPVFGSLFRKVAVARFTRTLGTLIKSGVPILTSLEIVEESSGNAVLARAVRNVKEAVKQGGSINEPLEKYPIFPPMVVSMIAVGEETGELDSMLSKIADFYDSEVETAVDALTSLLEPIMMVFLGGMVGAVIVGMYLPMFKIFEVVK